MESLRELFKIGHGPSSSHTMGPLRAANAFIGICDKKPARFEVTLYGALAATGRATSPTAPFSTRWNP